MSIAFDSFRWWRAEFDGRPNPYQSLLVAQDDSAGPAAAIMQGRENVGSDLDPSMALGGNSYDEFSSYEEFSNWHWPAALTFDDGDSISTSPLY